MRSVKEEYKTHEAETVKWYFMTGFWLMMHGRLFSKLVIPAGASIGYHEHSSEFETFYVISGEATVDDNGTQVVLKPGDMHTCKDGDGHGVRNNGTEDLVMIALILNTLG